MFGNSTTGFTMEDMFEEPVPCMECGDIVEFQCTRKCRECGRMICPDCVTILYERPLCEGCVSARGDRP